jgi:hypothetical protein
MTYRVRKTGSFRSTLKPVTYLVFNPSGDIVGTFYHHPALRTWIAYVKDTRGHRVEYRSRNRKDIEAWIIHEQGA